MGTKIASGMVVISGRLADPPLISIGRASVIGEESFITPHSVMTDGNLMLGEVKIGNGVVIGIKAVVMPDVEIGDNSMVLPMSMVASGTRIPQNEVWGGNPAVKVKNNF